MHFVGVVSQHPSPNVSWLHALCPYASIYHWWYFNVGERNDSYSVCRDNVVMSQTVAFASYHFMVIKTIQMLQLIFLSLSGVFCLIFIRKIGVGTEIIQPRSLLHEYELPCWCQC